MVESKWWGWMQRYFVMAVEGADTSLLTVSVQVTFFLLLCILCLGLFYSSSFAIPSDTLRSTPF